jgi:hypothetical protein
MTKSAPSFCLRLKRFYYFIVLMSVFFASRRIGSVPPFGFLPGEKDGMAPVQVLMDASVHDLGPNCSVLVGGGSADTVLKISVDNLLYVLSCENGKSGMREIETVQDLCRSNHSAAAAASGGGSGGGDVAAVPQPCPMNLADSSSPPSFLRLACDASIARAGEQFLYIDNYLQINCSPFAGKWLRAMGVDCTIVDVPSIDAIQAKLAEGYVFLSADRKLVDKREFQNAPVN